jgi:two-component system chemotaxis response regulator CheY
MISVGQVMKRVLVIEDDMALSWVANELLQSEYQLVVMNDGFEAWVWLSDGNFLRPGSL